MQNKNKKLAKSLFIISAVFLITPSYAANGWNFFNNKDITKKDEKTKTKTKIKNHELYIRGILAFQDDITKDQDLDKLKLTEEEKHQAQVWGLTKEQEKRYTFLMNNKSGTYYKNTKLTPVEILGINAKDDGERNYYAMLDASQEWQKNAKILAFNTAFQKATRQMQNMQGIPIIREFDYTKYSPYSYEPINLQSNDKLMLFIKLNDSVKPIISYLINSITKNPKIQLNIYFIEDGIKEEKEKITQWAKGQNIPFDMVNKKEITLNFGSKQYEELKDIKKKTPILTLIRNGKSRLVDTGRF